MQANMDRIDSDQRIVAVQEVAARQA